MKMYVVYDIRAADGDTDRAQVLFATIEDSLEEVIAWIRKDFGEGVVFSYDMKGNILEKEQLEQVVS